MTHKDNEDVTKNDTLLSVPRILLPECITNQDIWIDRWVTNSSLNYKLKHIVKALAQKQDVTYYTDGSLKQEQPLEINGILATQERSWEQLSF